MGEDTIIPVALAGAVVVGVQRLMQERRVLLFMGKETLADGESATQVIMTVQVVAAEVPVVPEFIMELGHTPHLLQMEVPEKFGGLMECEGLEEEGHREILIFKTQRLRMEPLMVEAVQDHKQREEMELPTRAVAEVLAEELLQAAAGLG